MELAACGGIDRLMWHSLRIHHGIIIPRQEVQTFVSEIDPEGCEVQR